MDIKTIAEVLSQNVETYDRALAGIRQCMAAYEEMCVELIKAIGESSSMEDANQKFDALFEIQNSLCTLLYARNIDIGDRLTKLTNEFDRLTIPTSEIIGLNVFKPVNAGPHDLPPVADLSIGLNVRFVNVDGVRLQYNAFKLPDGAVNIGRIHEGN